MFQVNQLTGFGGGGDPLSLTYKGHGQIFKDAGTGDTALSYGTVNGGSAPAAGDLVVWHWLIGVEDYDTSPVEDNRRNDLTGLGWTQSNAPAIMGAVDGTTPVVSTILAKVLAASDLSAPPVIQEPITLGAGSYMNFALWVAYTVSGSVSSLAIPVHTRNSGGASAPSNVPVDSSALNPPAEAITTYIATGTDGSITISGITADYEATQNNFGQYFDAILDARIGAKKDIGGASYTLSKSDDGDANYLIGGYVSAS